ncbi:MAG: DEAD/DEAH box helicase [Nitrospira sp. SB0677_bin_15]|nr:DEAD/DEAH box helicase [Nitrospira sp. SB0661_bin_20]MYG39757.1 DEAD/DEAH box helicase [Nitrospira sp. SB0677_bin_15]MYJ22012.1 DEAD/DEAH box helicase [Nitrospira sp. SB0673_bin_12]
MHLKTYQQNALEQLDRWLGALKEAHKDAADGVEFYAKKKRPIPEELKNYPLSAWNSLKEQNVLPGISDNGTLTIPDYISRTGTSGAPIPHVCLKVPTGGGKTLLGVTALERIKQDVGFVLWIVPTRAIYEQTLKAFRTREHPYRQMLERISGGKVKLLQKDDRFTRQDVESRLCIMTLMLPSANRQKGRDFLKIFRDSGSYTSFFPEQDDPTANRALSERHPDLEKNNTAGSAKHSLINVLKLIRPTVILDEAHKAYGPNDKNNREFVKSVNQLNPRFVLELSATPKIGISNILVNISGTELQAEEMIKLPIEIHSFGNSDWKHTLAETQRKLQELETEAQRLQTRENRYIRPIALVRVQRTGGEQRGRGTIHSEDVREHLIQQLAVPQDRIRVQSSEQKELTGEDLLGETSPVRWIITKDALKEGWDCAFAYVLALLDDTTATTAMTQMTGRIMRQPHARRIEQSEALNRCYIYCYNTNVGVAVERVKAGLENEGLTGLGNTIRGAGEGDAPQPQTIKRRPKYKRLQIFLPQVLHEEGYRWRPLDYDRDILGAINWSEIDVGEAVNPDDDDTIREIIATVDVQGDRRIFDEALETGERLSLDYFVRRLTDVVPNPWQAARMTANFLKKHTGYDDSKLLNNRIYLSEVLRRSIKEDLDKKAESVFRSKIKNDAIRFHLETDEKLDYELEKSLEVYVSSQERALQGEHGLPIQQSLFDPVHESNFNGLEKDFALYLDKSNAISWWHKIAAKQQYHLQGWRRQRVYPDFVACQRGDGRLLILETKGIHLKGNEDTNYKQQLLATLEAAYNKADDRGEMRVCEPPAVFRMMFEDRWKEQANALVAE